MNLENISCYHKMVLRDEIIFTYKAISAFFVISQKLFKTLKIFYKKILQ